MRELNSQEVYRELEGRNLVLLSSSVKVATWIPKTATAATEVQIIVDALERDLTGVLRLTSPEALDELVAVLVRARREVWPIPIARGPRRGYATMAEAIEGGLDGARAVLGMAATDEVTISRAEALDELARSPISPGTTILEALVRRLPEDRPISANDIARELQAMLDRHRATPPLGTSIEEAGDALLARALAEADVLCAHSTNVVDLTLGLRRAFGVEDGSPLFPEEVAARGLGTYDPGEPQDGGCE